VIPAAADDTAVEPNVIERAALREGIVECPLCGRQLADPLANAIVQGPGEVTVETADAVECPVCDGVTFVVDGE